MALIPAASYYDPYLASAMYANNMTERFATDAHNFWQRQAEAAPSVAAHLAVSAPPFGIPSTVTVTPDTAPYASVQHDLQHIDQLAANRAAQLDSSLSGASLPTRMQPLPATAATLSPGGTYVSATTHSPGFRPF
eukprot:TRINITY_DN95281_c0_g1_i1.p1 TRINITY_DN95281_c0_g1~~TRINITY_DN95281_c0_g1_i1.p1  ORF type:complete len:143 (+),score=7.83 TRINITY_DN95281_c0_g1_i1:27-431(+)